MKKRLYSALLAGLAAVLLFSLMGFSTQAKGKHSFNLNLINLESGGIGVPLGMANEQFPGLYHQPTDGIIAGNGGIGFGCVPDVHEFNKSTAGEHIVFTAGVKEFATHAAAAKFLDYFSIYVEIRSNGKKVLELPFQYHVNHETGEVAVDPNTGKPFWVSALYFKNAYPGATVIDLPTGEYNYKFKAISKGIKGHGKKGYVLDVWAPKNNKFTIVE
ncbi:hypothetical protein [Bacillus sp. T33-2]|uniref:hypothetical protein n=1 Tax=Bacillus sp. T33-2 TaxID=2054168 RepID=UPI000C780783|nr:hypothetical protein [Bacillus sp. T33-2]PLR96493.1 hypothetical protein CVD19_10880 [Bacillus sp. T33-2]